MPTYTDFGRLKAAIADARLHGRRAQVSRGSTRNTWDVVFVEGRRRQDAQPEGAGSDSDSRNEDRIASQKWDADDRCLTDDELAAHRQEAIIAADCCAPEANRPYKPEPLEFFEDVKTFSEAITLAKARKGTLARVGNQFRVTWTG